MAAKEPGRERVDLMVQLQAWPGERIAHESLVAPAAQGAADAVVYGYLGDVQLRFVFEDPGVTPAAVVRADDLQRLDLTAGKALALAVLNTKRAGGTPQVSSLAGGVYTLRSRHRAYDPSYLLDRSFWRAQLAKFPQGLLATLPSPGVLLFAPAGDAGVQQELVRASERLLAKAGGDAISACVFRFDATGWHAEGALRREQPAERETAARRAAENEELAAELDLEKAARGQRMLVFSILGAFVMNALQAVQVNIFVVLALGLFLTGYSLLAVVRLGSGLGRSTGGKITLMVLSCIPLVSLVLWVVLSVQTTRALRAAGWDVGLLGVKG